jgi:arylsulfatase A-like enzyme
LRGGKHDVWEGGFRVPFIVRWPGQVPAGTQCEEMINLVDLYQQPVGVYSAGDGGRGFDQTLPIFPSFLPKEYVSTAIGKWQFGLDEDYPELK